MNRRAINNASDSGVRCGDRCPPGNSWSRSYIVEWGGGAEGHMLTVYTVADTRAAADKIKH
jgi:hypothetical protein